jgi:hypothetical protein
MMFPALAVPAAAPYLVTAPHFSALHLTGLPRSAAGRPLFSFLFLQV